LRSCLEFDVKVWIKKAFLRNLENGLMLKYVNMPITTHHYRTEEITVVWKPEICIHSGICAQGLADVFNPHRKPWIDLSQAEAQQIIDQVKKCPSGALSIEEKTDK
jgi:uncharacterized Fe-S cluster protein YjdI